jgi:hypothetical protein
LAFIFKLHSNNQVEACSENWLGHYKKDVAKKILETVIWRDEDEQRQCLAVDTSGAFGPDDMLFAAQAVDPGPFVLGCREIWKDDFPEVEPVAVLDEHPFWEER